MLLWGIFKFPWNNYFKITNLNFQAPEFGTVSMKKKERKKENTKAKIDQFDNFLHRPKRKPAECFAG